MTKRAELISYAISFTSFLLDSPAAEKIRKVILFGSVARGDFTDESDIDLFIDAPQEIEKEVEKIRSLFEVSQINKHWKLRGISQELSLKTGNLDAWQLKREVISSGILLYGKYTELPKDARAYLIIRIVETSKKAAQQVKLWRALYGYTQKVGKKRYVKRGLLTASEGKKLGKAVLALPMEKRRAVLDLLNKHKARYTLHECWSDAF